LGDLAAFGGEHHMAARAELLRQRHAELPGDVVVAGAGAPQLLFAARSRTVAPWPGHCDIHDGFEHSPGWRAGGPVVAMAARLHETDELAVAELGEMPARGLR